MVGVAGLPDPPADHPQRRREPRQERLDLLGGGLVQQPGEYLGAAADADAAALVVAERPPLGLGEGPVDQRQRVALLVAKMPVQCAGQGIGGVGEALVAAVAVGKRAVDGGQQRVEAGVLLWGGEPALRCLPHARSYDDHIT